MPEKIYQKSLRVIRKFCFLVLQKIPINHIGTRQKNNSLCTPIRSTLSSRHFRALIFLPLHNYFFLLGWGGFGLQVQWFCGLLFCGNCWHFTSQLTGKKTNFDVTFLINGSSKVSTTIVEFSSFLAIIFSGIEIYFQIMLKKFNDDFSETHKLRLPRAFFAVFHVTIEACNVAFCSVRLHFWSQFLHFDDGGRSCETFGWKFTSIRP